MNVTDVISPELVLVSPDLRAAALAALPERDPNAFLFSEGTRKTATRHPELDRFEFLADYSNLGPLRHHRRRMLLGKAAAYALVSLAQLLLIWSVVIGTLIAVVAVTIWIV